MIVDYKNNKFILNNKPISLDYTFKLWFSNKNVDWKQNAFKQMIKLNNINL